MALCNLFPFDDTLNLDDALRHCRDFRRRQQIRPDDGGGAGGSRPPAMMNRNQRSEDDEYVEDDDEPHNIFIKTILYKKLKIYLCSGQSSHFAVLDGQLLFKREKLTLSIFQ